MGQYPFNLASGVARSLPTNPFVLYPDLSSLSAGDVNFPGYQPSGTTTPGLPDSESLSYQTGLAWPASINELVQPQLKNVNMSVVPRSGVDGQIPSLQELRQLNLAATPSSSPNYHWSLPTQGSQTLQKATGSPPLPAEVTNLVSDVLITQSKIAGISSVVAEYLAWARKAPKADSIELLQTLEDRIREIHTMARSKDWAASPLMSDPDTILDSTIRACLGDLKEEVSRTTCDLDKFFIARYCVDKTLDDQYRPSSTGGQPTPTNTPMVLESHQDTWK